MVSIPFLEEGVLGFLKGVVLPKVKWVLFLASQSRNTAKVVCFMLACIDQFGEYVSRGNVVTLVTATYSIIFVNNQLLSY